MSSIQILSGLKNPDGSLAAEVVPAKNYDTLFGFVTYLLSAHFNGGNALNLWTVDSALSIVSAKTVPVQSFALPPPASQKSTAAVPSPPTIATQDARLVNAVYQPNL